MPLTDTVYLTHAKINVRVVYPRWISILSSMPAVPDPHFGALLHMLALEGSLPTMTLEQLIEYNRIRWIAMGKVAELMCAEPRFVLRIDGPVAPGTLTDGDLGMADYETLFALFRWGANVSPADTSATGLGSTAATIRHEPDLPHPPEPDSGD